MAKEITIEIKDMKKVALFGLLIVFLTVVFYQELKVTFNSPISFGDEGFHTRVAQEIAKQTEYFVSLPFEGTKLFKVDLFERPPLWNILESSFFVFGYNEFIVKTLTPFIAAILVGISIFVVASKLYNKRVGLFAALIIVALPSFATYSILFYTDILFTWFFSLSILLLVYAMRTEKLKYFILAGVLGSLAILSKTPGFLIIPIFGICFLYSAYIKRSFVKPFKNFAFLALFLVLVTSGFFIRNLNYFGTPYCGLPFGILSSEKCSVTFDYTAKYEYSGRTAQTGTEASVFSPAVGGLTGYLAFAYGDVNLGFLAINLFVLLLICGTILFVYRRNITDMIILLAAVMFIPLFLYTTGRAEDTARYTLAFAPLFAIVAGNYLDSIWEFANTHLVKFSFIILVAVVAVLLYFSYQNVCGTTLDCSGGKLATMYSVKQFSPAFFEACNWVKQNVDEDAVIWTIWGHRMVYNCQRTNAGTGPDTPDIVLSNDLNLALSRLKANGITHLFIQKFSMDLNDQHLMEEYDSSFVQFLEDNPEHFKLVYENGLSINVTNRNVKSYIQYCIQQTGYICDGNLLYKVVDV